MNKELYPFFVSCPHCRKNFTVPAEIVLKYVDRLMEALSQKIQANLERKRSKAMKREGA
jgi:hypothetical protein